MWRLFSKFKAPQIPLQVLAEENELDCRLRDAAKQQKASAAAVRRTLADEASARFKTDRTLDFVLDKISYGKKV